MKRKTILMSMSFLILTVLFTANATAGGNISDTTNGHIGPAPNSGDCDPDGSGFDSPNGPNGAGSLGNGHTGPAPNSGDCDPDGPGW